MNSGLQRVPAADYWRVAMQLLAEGNYELGWRLWETRPIEMGGRPSGKPSLGFPEWNGGSLESLVILPEQGLGDQIMFARYAPYLKARGITVALMCHPLLARLFRSLGVTVISALGRVALPQADAWALGPSLPYLCKTTLESIPPAPYLTATPRPEYSGKIGIMARGNPKFAHDAARSLDAVSADALLALPGAVDLSISSTGAVDLQDTAEIISAMDAVVAVDTAVAHLAGALGKRCFLLLPHHADWRWMRERRDSPWYPSMTLIRQPEPGDWRPVIEETRRVLRQE